MAILSTVILSLNALTDKISNIYKDVTVRYDPSLTYETGDTLNRAETRYDNSDTNKDNTELPLFLFNRSTLRRSEMGGRGPRLAYETDTDRQKLDLDTFSVIHAEYDFRFLFVDKNIESLERFEVDFLSNQMLTSILDCSIDLSAVDLGEWTYYVTWNEQLDDFTVNTDGSSYISVGGSATVRGYFLSLVGTSPVIASINTKLLNHRKQLLEEITIPKEN